MILTPEQSDAVIRLVVEAANVDSISAIPLYKEAAKIIAEADAGLTHPVEPITDPSKL